MTAPMATPSPSPELRHCIKCGREIGPDESICELCNRAGMATPSASQYHGTVAAAIVAAVAVLAIAASLSMRGVGPYAAEVRDVSPGDPVGYAITYAVTNEGTTPGRAKCQLVALGDAGERLRTRNTITGQIAGGATSEQTETIPGLDAAPAEVSISCS
jgi:predicted nucleic acid-binding Zn ribbon protein